MSGVVTTVGGGNIIRAGATSTGFVGVGVYIATGVGDTTYTGVDSGVAPTTGVYAVT